MLNQVLSVKRFAGYLAFAGAVASIFTPRAKAPAPPPKHGLTGNYYVGSGGWYKDTLPATGGFLQIWTDQNDFSLPRTFTAPATTRVDAQVAFGQGKGFNAKSAVPAVVWWPTGFPLPPGWTNPNEKPWNQLAAVIWKGYIHLPKAGVYYFGVISNGPSAVYLNRARVALSGLYGGVLVSDAFTYAKEDAQNFVQNLNEGRESVVSTPNPREQYVVPVSVDAPRDLPIEVHYNASNHFTHWGSEPFGIDLFWVTPDSPRDDKGKLVASIVPSEALYTEPPSPIEKPVVRSANSTISADFLYFPAQGAEGAVTFTIRLADKDGNPASGKRVYVNSLNEWNPDAIVQPDKPTDKNGETTAKIRANAANPVAHDSAIFGTDLTDLVDVAQVAHVTFQQTGSFFFPDAFSPYYDPNIPSVEPLPLRVGHPVTIKAPLVNRNKFTAEVTVTFSQNAWNIGATGWSEIGTVKNVRLQPGEHKDVSITWTPEQTTGHICFRVDVSGRVTAVAHVSGNNLVASLLPTAGLLAMAQGQQQQGQTDSHTQNYSGVQCKPDEGKRCQDIGKALATIAAARQPIGSDSLYRNLQQNLGSQLDQLRAELCDNPAAQSKLDEIRHNLNSLNFVQGASNLQNNQLLLRIEDGLKELSQMVCYTAPPSDSGVCESGKEKADAGDEEAAKFIKEKFKEAYDQASEKAREIEDHGGLVPPTLRDQIKKYKMAMQFWENIKAGSCVPVDVLQTMQDVIRDRRASNYSENCDSMCTALANWYRKMIVQDPNVENASQLAEAMVKVFRDDCMARCH